MAFQFKNKTWSYTGTKEFENGGFTLLNPTVAISSVTIQQSNIYITLNAFENGGVYPHHLHIQYNNIAEETNLDTIVDTAIASALPDFVLNT
jgi:hypothetical protein